MLVFIKASTNSVFGIGRRTPVSVSTAWRTCLTPSGLTSLLGKSNKHGENILTFWTCCCRLKYTWIENENLRNVVFNKKCQGCYLFSKPRTSDGVSRLGLGLETCLKTRFLEPRSRYRRSQVSSQSRALRLETLHWLFFMKFCKKEFLKNGF